MRLKIKKSTAHVVNEFLLLTSCYQLSSTSTDTFSATTTDIEESSNKCQVHIQFEGYNSRAFCIHTFIIINAILRYISVNVT